MPGSSHRRLRHYLLAALFLAGTLPASPSRPATAAEDNNPDGALAARIDAWIAQPRFAAANWGIAVASLDSGKAIYGHRADRLAQPASIAKLFTAAVSLATLGPDYRMTTRLLSRGTIQHGRLNGDLILYGTGDPTLGTDGSADWAGQFAARLGALGIRQIHGDLIADDSFFSGPSFGSGWEAGDLQSWFAVPSSALSVDENVVDVTVTPGPAAGLPASLKFAPADGIPNIAGTIATTLPRTSSDINLYRAPGSDTLYVFGNLPARSPPRHFHLAMADPALEAARQLRVALIDHGIRISGDTRTLHWPLDDRDLLAHADILAELPSPPVLEILQRGLKRSQNLYLQNLLLSVGARERAIAAAPPHGFLDSEGWGLRVLRDLLARVGIAPDASRIAEGSGLSRRDLVTPDAMVRLLEYLAAQPYAAKIRDALPLAGVDGTLAYRMRRTPAAGNLQAKTGSMTYVDSLAGYVTSAAGERLAFAIMLDNYQAPKGSPSASSDIDTIAVWLAEYGGGDRRSVDAPH